MMYLLANQQADISVSIAQILDKCPPSEVSRSFCSFPYGSLAAERILKKFGLTSSCRRASRPNLFSFPWLSLAFMKNLVEKRVRSGQVTRETEEALKQRRRQ